MERGFNAGQTHSIIPIYLQPFTSYGEILVGNCNFFPTPLHLTPPLGCSHWNSEKKFGLQKTRIMGLPGSEDSLAIGWAVSTLYQWLWRTDRQTGRQTDSLHINNIWLTHVKNECKVCGNHFGRLVEKKRKVPPQYFAVDVHTYKKYFANSLTKNYQVRRGGAKNVQQFHQSWQPKRYAIKSCTFWKVVEALYRWCFVVVPVWSTFSLRRQMAPL